MMTLDDLTVHPSPKESVVDLKDFSNAERNGCKFREKKGFRTEFEKMNESVREASRCSQRKVT